MQRSKSQIRNEMAEARRNNQSRAESRSRKNGSREGRRAGDGEKGEEATKNKDMAQTVNISAIKLKLGKRARSE